MWSCVLDGLFDGFGEEIVFDDDVWNCVDDVGELGNDWTWLSGSSFDRYSDGSDCEIDSVDPEEGNVPCCQCNIV